MLKPWPTRSLEYGAIRVLGGDFTARVTRLVFLLKKHSVGSLAKLKQIWLGEDKSFLFAELEAWFSSKGKQELRVNWHGF